MQHDTSLLNKIRALLAKAESTDSDAERDTFLAKAQELMEKHQVDLFALHQDDPLGWQDGVEAQAGPPKYKADVQTYLARYYGLEVIMWGISGGKFKVRMVGPESARLTTELLTPFVWAQVCDRAKTLAASGRAHNKAAAIRMMAKALCVRLYRLTEMKKTQPAAPGTSFSLVVVNAVDEYVKKEFPNLKEGRERVVQTTATARDLAETISINQQMNHGKTLRLE